jgi:hypothetical protein
VIIMSNQRHQILLRGPWDYAVLSPAETPCPFPATGVVRLPEEWVMMSAGWSGTVRFERTFHPPTGLEPDDRVCIAFLGVQGRGRVSLAGRVLGELVSSAEQQRFDITGLLGNSNRLKVELSYAPIAGTNTPGWLYLPVAIQIYDGPPLP